MSRFLSLFLLSALAVAFLAGLRTTAPDMERTADLYFDNQSLMDLRILSTLGLTDEDIDILASQPGIQAAEGAYTVDALIHMEQNDLIIKILSISPTGINAPELVEGRLPENDRECVVEQKVLTSSGLAIGDTISFDTGEDTFEDALKYDTYTVVGIVNSPLYVSIERGSSSLGAGRVSAFAMLPDSAFDMDYYTDGYLLADGAAQLLCYSDGYDALVDGLKTELEPLSDRRAALRYDDVVGEANEKLDDAQKEFDDAEQEANEKLADAEKELSDARVKLDDGWAEYYDGEATLKRETADAKQKIADAEKELPDAKVKLEDGEREYADGLKELEDGKVEFADGLQKWQDGKQKYDEGYQKLVDGEKEYSENYDKLADGQKEYDDGLKEYQDGLVELQNGAGMLAAAKKQLDSASAQLDAGSAQLAEGQKEYDKGLALYEGQVTQLNLALSQPPLSLSMTNDQLVDFLEHPPTEPTDPMYPLYMGIVQAIGSENVTALVASRQALADAKAQLDSGAAALSSGASQYRAGKKEYNEAKATFDESVVKLQDAKKELDDAQAELDDGWAQLADGRRELDDGWDELNDAKKELDDGKKELDDNSVKIADAEQELADARVELDDGWKEYNDGVAELADAKIKLPTETAKAERELADALVELNDGEREYADGLVEYEDGRREADEELSDARKKLNDARRDIAKIENCEWYVLGRNTNMGYVAYQQDSERMGNLASVFPLIFFLVAALVCLTTMTRMVEEQRVQIGGMKALGYSRGAIALKYVGYGFLASFLGGTVGLVVGCLAIPWVIFSAWGALYTIGDLIIPFYPGISLMSVGAAVLCVTGTALATAFATLHAVPAELMRPRAPKPGKRVLLERIKPLWSHMSFTWKVTARNLFRYQRRFWMTVVGIGGCTALIVAGFGIRDSILNTLNNQYDYISTYSAEVSLADDLTNDEMLEIARALDKNTNVEVWMPSYTESLSVESPKRTMDATLFAVEDMESFGDFIHLRHRLDDKAVTLPPEGAVITEKLSEMLGVKVGDTLTLDGDKRVQVTISDITENYILHYVYISAEYYEQLFGEPPATNVLLARYADESKEAADIVSSELISLSGVSSVSRIRETRETFSKSLGMVDYAVVVVIVAAAALAFVVLFNLTNINITERLRELATLKVLGFYDGELSTYVYRENVFLTIFGVLMGLVMGKFLHQWLVLTVEIDMVMFGRTAKPISYLYAVALTLLFSFLVNLVARKKLKKIDMVESLKTVD